MLSNPRNILTCVAFLGGSLLANAGREAVYQQVVTGQVNEPSEVLVLLPDSVKEIEARAQAAITQAEKGIAAWLESQGTTSELLRDYDRCSAHFDSVRNSLFSFAEITPKSPLYEAATSAVSRLDKEVARLFHAPAVADAIARMVPDNLPADEQRFCRMLQKAFARDECLSSEQRRAVDDIRRRCVEMHLQCDELMKKNEHDAVERLVVELLRLRQEEATMYRYANYAEMAFDDSFYGSFNNFKKLTERIRAKLAGMAHEQGKELVAYAREHGMTEMLEGDHIKASSFRDLEQHRAQSLALKVEDSGSEFFVVTEVVPKICQLYERFTGWRVTLSQQPYSEEGCFRWLIGFYEQKAEKPHGVVILDTYKATGAVGVTHPWVLGVEGATTILSSQTKYSYVHDDMPCFSWDEVGTVFHELGHAVAGSAPTSYSAWHANGFVPLASRVYGRSGEIAELEGVFFEKIRCDNELSAFLSAHYQTGEPISSAIVDGLSAVDWRRPFRYQRVLWWGADIFAHMFVPLAGASWLDTVKQFDAAYFPLNASRKEMNRMFDFLRFYLFREHYGPRLDKYSLVGALSCYIQSSFKEKGVDSYEQGRRFTQTVLLNGGRLSAHEQLTSLLEECFDYDKFMSTYVAQLGTLSTL